MASEIEMMKRFFDSAEAMIYLKDEEGRLLMVNDKVAELWNRPKEEIIGKTDYDFEPKEKADEIRKLDKEVMKTHRASTTNVKLTRPSGETIEVVDYKFPVAVEGHPDAVGGIAFAR